MSVKSIFRKAVNKLTPKRKVVYVERVRNVPVVVKRVVVLKQAPRKGLVVVRRQVRVTIRRKVAR